MPIPLETIFKNSNGECRWPWRKRQGPSALIRMTLVIILHNVHQMYLKVHMPLKYHCLGIPSLIDSLLGVEILHSAGTLSLQRYYRFGHLLYMTLPQKGTIRYCLLPQTYHKPDMSYYSYLALFFVIYHLSFVRMKKQVCLNMSSVDADYYLAIHSCST